MGYKPKVCIVCGEVYQPSSPKQKACTKEACKNQVRRNAERARYHKKAPIYTKVCKICGIEFKTTNRRQVYCGSDGCGRRRCYIKNKRADEKRRGTRTEYRRQYRLSNLEKITQGSRAYYYNVLHPDRELKPYVPQPKWTYEDVKQYVEEERGFLLLSEEYINNKTKLELLCPEGHLWLVSFHAFKDGGLYCPTCTSLRKKSRPEEDLYRFVSRLVGDDKVISNSRKIISPYELDVYVPENKLAIEYCGLTWHSEIFGGKDRRYHYNKMSLCMEKGIRLITIFEDEFLERPEVVKSRIRNALNKCSIRVFARRCIVKEITTYQSRQFLDKFHLQGSIGATKKWGLFFKGVLVQVLTVGSLSRHHAGAEKKTLELKRFASLPNVAVIGGASKLFSEVKKFSLDEGYSQIKSYCDMRYANYVKPVYEKLGFKLATFTKWTPHYVKNQRRFRNQGLRKTPEERLTGLTEWELRRAQGFDRIWDCGHRTYVMDLRS